MKRCVHCWTSEGPFTRDHVFPDSWYPDTTPSTVQRWTVACCRKCNATYGELERDLLTRLALCLDPTLEATSGLAARALRDLGIDAEGLKEVEKAHRARRREQIKSELFPAAEVRGRPGGIPGLDWAGSETGIAIAYAGLALMAEKIARGCEYKYKSKKRYVEPPYGVRATMTPSGVRDWIYNFGQQIDFGPGCKVLRVPTIEDPKIVRYWIGIWATLTFDVFIDLEEYFVEGMDPYLKRVEGRTPNGPHMQVPEYLRKFESE